MKLRQDQIDRIEVKINTSGKNDVVLITTSGRRDLPPDEHNQNVYCVDSEYNIVWQIHTPASSFENDAFIYLERKGTQLSAERFSGFEYVIDVKTGNAKQVDWHK